MPSRGGSAVSEAASTPLSHPRQYNWRQGTAAEVEGSGAIGIEAISRGARHAYFVEKNKKAIECIKFNVIKCKFQDEATIIARDVSDALYEIHDKADIIFMDPPYDSMNESNIMKQLLTSKIIHEDTIFIIEAAIERDFSDITSLGYEIYKEKFYKTNKHVFFRLATNS